MQALNATHIRILRQAPGLAPADPAALLSPAWLKSAEVLKEDDRAAVLAGNLDGRPVVLKLLRLSRPSDAPARILGATRLQREWKGYTAMRKVAVPCAEPLCLLRARDHRGAPIEALATARLPGDTLLRIIATKDTPAPIEHELAAELGRLTARLDRAGLRNRDHKPSNIIANLQSPRGERLAIIDAAGIRRRRPRAVEEMLANLAVEMLGAHALPRRPLLMRCLRVCDTELDTGQDHKTRWRTIADAIRRHGDPTPKIDPLKH